MIQTYTLPNGLRIVMERLPYLRSASAGIFVKAGSILESQEETGLSHFIEHMAFKGTKNRSTRQLAEEIDMIGGNVNAATSKVCTSYYARTTDRDLPQAVNLLADLVVHPNPNADEFSKERGVIREEIAMEADSPEDLVFNLIHQGLYDGQSLSRTILGSQEAISGYTLESLEAFRRRFYQPANAVLAVTGNFDPKALIQQAEKEFEPWQGQTRARFPANTPRQGGDPLTLQKDTEQTHLCVAFKGLPSLHRDRHALIALSTAFGGGVSSRLFQTVREEKGLVYNIYCAPAFYPECGDFTIYAACSPVNLHQVLGIIRQETARIAADGLDEKEFLQTMAQLKTGFVLSMESAYQRMASLGINLLLHDRVIPPRETLAQMKRVRLKDVNRVVGELLLQEPKIAVVGRRAAKNLKGKGRIPNGQA